MVNEPIASLALYLAVSASKNVLLGSLNNICVEVCMRAIHNSFSFIWNNFFWKLLDDRTLVAVSVQQFQMLLQSDSIKLTLEE